MSTATEFLRRLGLKVPIIQGPFGGGLSTVRLAAIVANAGGLGSFGAHQLTADEINATVRDIRAATNGPFAINLWIPKDDDGPTDPAPAGFEEGVERFASVFEEWGVPLPDRAAPPPVDFSEQVEALLESRPPVFSFVFGIPSARILEACRVREIVTIGAATTVDEARALERAGVDAIVASGSDAGGHRPSFLQAAEASLIGTMALVPQIVDAVSRPVIGTGGIADARGVAAALALGAQAAQIGTAFLACEESGAHHLHRQALFSERSRRTLLSRASSGRLARFIRTSYFERYERGDLRALRYPLQAAFSRPIAQAAADRGDPEHMTLYSGQGAPLLKYTQAADLVRALAANTA